MDITWLRGWGKRCTDVTLPCAANFSRESPHHALLTFVLLTGNNNNRKSAGYILTEKR